MAPFSDVDLMILHTGPDADRVGRLSERMLCDVFDAGLELGHSVRTPEEACRLAAEEATIQSSLIESRLLAGDAKLYARFAEQFHGRLRRRRKGVIAALEAARREERLKYGETVYLLEPNVKRSRGGLRDLQLLRWIGMARYGSREPAELSAGGFLSAGDLEVVEQATEFLLGLRNEMHFHAGHSADVLDRTEQWRIADLRGYPAQTGMLPVEQFMRDYFRHTDQVSHVVGRFLEKARSSGRRRLGTALWGHRIAGGFVVGPQEITARRHALTRLRGNLAAIVRLVELANLYDKQIAPETWEVVRREASRIPKDAAVAAEVFDSFVAILDHPHRLGELLRALHEVGVLERILPAFAHARGLLQFNQYHKYTVDEHSFRAVERVTENVNDPGPLGRIYRGMRGKRLLHLALLIHDLGKGYSRDHSEVGREIAHQCAERLRLDSDEAGLLEFLVHKHLLMNHLAFRRDTSDEQLVVRFAVEVGSPEVLQMLYLLTAADLGAVGPDAWNSWKDEVLADLYHRTMQHLAGESPSSSREEYLEGRREQVRTSLAPEEDRAWFAPWIETLPVAYLTSTDPQQIAADLRLLAGLGAREVKCQARYLPETQTVQMTVGTREDVVPGIFHRLTGALASQGLEILSAEINTLSDGLVLDRFWVYDPDYAGEPPAERLERIEGALAESLLSEGGPPTFRRVWSLGGTRRPAAAVAADSRADRQYDFGPLYDHRRVHARPARTSLRGHAGPVRAGLFGVACEDRNLPGPGGRRLLRHRSAGEKDRGCGAAAPHTATAARGDRGDGAGAGARGIKPLGIRPASPHRLAACNLQCLLTRLRRAATLMAGPRHAARKIPKSFEPRVIRCEALPCGERVRCFCGPRPFWRSGLSPSAGISRLSTSGRGLTWPRWKRGTRRPRERPIPRVRRFASERAMPRRGRGSRSRFPTIGAIYRPTITWPWK